MSVLRAEAPAKVNLALAVTGRRADGYHTLRSVFVALTLHDELEVELDPEGVADSIVIDGEQEAPVADNLVLRAPARLREIIEGPLPPLRYRLTKHIPAAAGLGGSSSDAAAAIDLALAAWGVRLHPSRRLEVALELGADVPFFAAGHAAALIDGIGEGLHPLPEPDPPAGLLLITPRQRLSTASVFDEHDRDPAPGRSTVGLVDELATVLREGIDGQVLAATTAMLRDANDLWAAAARLSPSLATARVAATDSLGHAVLLTGSGATLYAVYPSEAVALRAARQLRSQRPSELEGAVIIATSTATQGGRP